jgi:putative methionine-R-sulfoxide reductase with GAF domain
MNPVVRSSAPNRRRRVRHKIQAPAYASFTGASKGKMPDLNEILDISEDGVSVQCGLSLEPHREFDLCLDLAESSAQIRTSGQVIWSDASGRSGFRFSDLPPVSLFHLREWLFLNAMAGVANAQGRRENAGLMPENVRPSYTDTLDTLSAVEREVEAVGADLAAALQLIAVRAQTLTRSSGVAIALVAADPGFMVCRASAGEDAPPTNARLEIGSGFSGECVRRAKLLRCDDTETDSLVNRETCRALGLRSILATPIKVGEKVIGIIEAFSLHPFSFTDTDGTTLQRLAETVLVAVNRAGRNDNPSSAAPLAPSFVSSPGSVLFASENKKEKKEREENASDENVAETQTAAGGIHLPRSYLFVLICAAATIALVLGYYLAPGIQSRFQGRESVQEQTVLASSHAPTVTVTADSASLPHLQQMAAQGDSAAENSLGLLYAQGDDKEGVSHDEKEAARWFQKAAEHGNPAAQSKLGSLYWSGRGVPQDFNKAYFWTVLARAGGDEASKALAPFVAARLTAAQAQSIEQQAEVWFQQHQPQPQSTTTEAHH